jgi:hypothetical protein
MLAGRFKDGAVHLCPPLPPAHEPLPMKELQPLPRLAPE